MQHRPANPYYNMNAILNADMLIGRERELRRIYSVLVNRQNISLVGPHKSGKTSLLHCIGAPYLQERYASDLTRHILVFLNVKAFLEKSGNDFFDAVNRRILGQGEKLIELRNEADNGADGFDSLLEQIKEQDFHTVLLMDNFDGITQNKRLKAEFFSLLRSQVDMGKVSYVTASRSPLDKVAHEGSPLFTLFSVCKLEPFSSEEALELITVLSTRAGLPFTEEESVWLVTQGGRYPFILQRLCYFLFEEKAHASTVAINYRQVAKQAYDELCPYLEEIWKSLDADQQGQIQREIRTASSGKADGGEKMPGTAGALFRKYVQKRYQQPASYLDELTTEELEEILDHLNDARYLDESVLKQWKLVGRQYANGKEGSSIERGMTIRKMLSDALERMRGSGSRTDSADEWRYYNILSYTYFRPPHRMTNEQLATNLGISARTYYRERREAIEILRTVLLELETGTGKQEED